MAAKAALVTGAASGIGQATALRLAAEGARVGLADLNEPGAGKVADAIRKAGGEAIAMRLDVTVEADWRGAMGQILAAWGRLDICVNCAGIAYARPITELDLAEWRRVMATNLDGVFLGTKHALQAMSRGGGGCVINIASASGIKPLPGNSVYGTSKAAIRFFSKVAALEGKPSGIRVNCISPGAVATPMWESTEMWPKEVAEAGGKQAALSELVEKQSFARPEAIAEAVVYLVCDEARHITGTDLVVDDGFTLS